MTSERGSFISGRLPMKYGRYIVESPIRQGHSSRHQGRGSTEPWIQTGVDMNTVLITGCSSGYGLETARHFHAQGWNVIATMRTPREDVLHRSERLRIAALDVTEPESI